MANTKELESLVNDSSSSTMLEEITEHEDLFGFWVEGILLVEMNQKRPRLLQLFVSVGNILCWTHRKFSLYLYVFNQKEQGKSSLSLIKIFQFEIVCQGDIRNKKKRIFPDHEIDPPATWKKNLVS